MEHWWDGFLSVFILPDPCRPSTAWTGNNPANGAVPGNSDAYKNKASLNWRFKMKAVNIRLEFFYKQNNR